MGSLQDALLETGLAKEDQKRRQNAKSTGAGPERKKRRHSGKKDRGAGKRADSGRPKRAGNRGAAGSGPSDLERAWAARRKAEKAEKEREKQARVADQEARRKRNLELDGLVEGRVLNVDEADLPRYFEHLGRIRRVLCTPEQRAAINRGELGVVSLRGRYLIVAMDVLERYRALADDLVPDLSGAEPEAEDEGDYPPVPDDLTW
ncbi:MAG: DUF2058 family protein [Candidatus Wenzhouxiangella sp. M2_3B_020]